MTVHPAELYEQDLYAWPQAQARELRRFASTRTNLPLDLPHLAEEIADLGKDPGDGLRSWTARVIERLLLLEHSPATEPRRHRTSEVVNFRRDVEERMSETLRADLRRRLPQLYAGARRGLVTKLSRFSEGDVATRLPEACSYTLGRCSAIGGPRTRRETDRARTGRSRRDLLEVDAARAPGRGLTARRRVAARARGGRPRDWCSPPPRAAGRCGPAATG
jgi:hypothetical protein